MLNGGYDIVRVTETWLGAADGDEYNVEGYKLFRKDRTNRRGGGVALYVEDHLNEQEIPGSNSLVLCKAFWIRLLGGNEKGRNIGVCYRPPASKTATLILCSTIT